MTVVELAQRLRFVKEATNHNDGAWVEAILRVTGNKKGDPWCAAFVSFVLSIVTGGKNPLPNSASCETIHQFAIKNHLLVTDPRAGDVFLVLTDAKHAHHTGFCTGPASGGLVPTIEGNTNIDGSRDGWGVFARTRSLSPRLVFVRPPVTP